MIDSLKENDIFQLENSPALYRVLRIGRFLFGNYIVEAESLLHLKFEEFELSYVLTNGKLHKT